jgi:hypothetical protein
MADDAVTADGATETVDTGASEETVTAETTQRSRDFLACVDHDREAGQVCGECGDPLCGECATSVADVTLTHYDRGGFWRFVRGVGLFAGVPLLFTVLFPNLLSQVVGLLPGSPFFLKGSLVLGSVFVGVGSLSVVRYRTRFGLADLSPTVLTDAVKDFEFLVRKSNARQVCDDCRRDLKLQYWLGRGIGVLGLLLVLYGLYASFTAGLVFIPLKWSFLGVALVIAKGEIVTLVANRLL